MEANSAWDVHCKQADQQYKQALANARLNVTSLKEQLTDQKQQEDKKLSNLVTQLQEKDRLIDRAKVGARYRGRREVGRG